MSTLKSALRIIDKMSEYSGRIFAPLVIAIVIVIFYGVIARFVFHSPIIWGYGLATLIFSAYIISAGAYCLLHGAHVRMDLIYSRLSPRRRAILEVATVVVFFFFIGAMLWESTQQAWFATSIGRTRGELAWDVPIWPVMWGLPLFAFLLGLQGLAKFIRDLYLAITGRELTQDES